MADVLEKDIEAIVTEVLKKMTLPTSSPNGSSPQETLLDSDGDWGVFPGLDQAVAAASAAQKRIPTIAVREQVVRMVRRAARANARRLAEMAVDETGMGRVEDKVKKNLLVANRTPGPEILSPAAATGDAGLTLFENAPWGVIASVTPSTNPAATIFNNTISMVSGGNTVVYAVHPGAKRTTLETVKVVNKAVYEELGINNIITCVKEPSIETAQKLFTYPGINLLVVTGGEAVVDAAKKITDKRLIAAGAGNPPVVVDDTADLARAAQSIYDGASFDNNIVCCDEKEIIALDTVADKLKDELKNCGAVEISLDQADAIARKVLLDYPGSNPRPNPKWVGRDAAVLASAAGISVPETCRLLIVDAGTDTGYTFAKMEQMMPLIPILRARDFNQALEWALLLENDCRHSAGLHSKNIDNMDTMAKAVNTSLFVKNGPHIAGLGAGGEGWTSMTISTPTGEGVSNARTFVRLRRCTLVGSFRIA
ncbi:aldehyde dehydrogenase family protein [Desulfospira joergensenii]|uniref:aldehyde dehydrogenase family protein n=1 Tax=Desulfospira joergensenii TaxID=53329 RepID=UPI0003B5BEA8|nr:aldehyde dehydrogenase family protein [Desulfospira joergensenii]